MASPNPEGDKNKDKAAIKHESADEKRHQRARKTASLHDNPSAPANMTSDPDQHRSAEERYWKRQVLWQAIGAIATIAAFAAAAFYVCVAQRQVKEMEIQGRRAETALEVTQRAYVTLGRADGVLMEWEPLKENTKGTVRLYFQNTGNTAATEFYFNVELGLPEDHPEQISDWLKEDRWISPPMRHFFTQHIRPVPRKGLTLITQIVAAHSLFVSRVQTHSDLTQRTIRRIKNGHSEVGISGTFEYFDMFGGYCCQNFEAVYLWNTGEFVRLPPFRDNCPQTPASVCPHAVPPTPAEPEQHQKE